MASNKNVILTDLVIFDVDFVGEIGQVAVDDSFFEC